MENSTEDIILQTARAHFLRNGFAGTRLQDIADEAGINKALLHYYFRSKEKLYQQIITSILDTVIPKLSAALDTPGTVMDRVAVIVNTYIDTLSEQPDIPFFILSEVSQEKESFMAELHKRAHYFPPLLSFLQQVMEEQEQGKIRAISPIHLLLNVIGMCVFPFIAKPIFSNVAQLPEADFSTLMQERRTVIVEFVQRALRPD